MSRRHRSLLMLVSSMVIYGTIGIFRRLIPVSSGVLACSRGIIGALFLLVLLRIRGRKLRWNMGGRTAGLLALSGAVMGFNWILLFEAYHYTSVATATLCYYMQPVIVILASAVLFRERLTGWRLICAAAAVLGMVLVSGVPEQGMSGAGELRGILLGLGAAVLYAAVVLINKSVSGPGAYEKTIIGTEESSVADQAVARMLKAVEQAHDGAFAVNSYAGQYWMSDRDDAIPDYLQKIAVKDLADVLEA